jgi:acyl-ACP thioesterase
VPELVPEPGVGRVYPATRRVRLGDVSPRGRLRLDAVVRYLQDVADDDTRDAGFVDAQGWVVRRTVVEVTNFPTFLEPIALRTWCSGIGSRWAERRTSVVGEAGGHIEAATLWVHLDPTTMRPQPLPRQFHVLYGPSAAGRTIRARLRHADTPKSAAATRYRWPLRFTDFDVLGHVNNAAYWAIVEEQLAGRRSLRAPLRAEVEHRGALDIGTTNVELVVADDVGGLACWLIDLTGGLIATATVSSMVSSAVSSAS